MPITRKPKQPVNGASPKLNEHAVNALVNKGGSPSRMGRGPANGDRGADVPVIVRIPEADLFELDNLVSQRAVKTPRHHWLLEAIHEKIVREKAANANWPAHRERRQTRA